MDQNSSPKSSATDSLVCKLYVKNIHKNTNSKELENYFEKFGGLSDVSLIMEPTGGQNRGYAFVTFDNDKSVDDCLLCTSHSVDDRELDVRRVMPRSIQDRLLNIKTARIFVGGLPQGVSEQDITDYFNNKYSYLGKVKEVLVKKDRQTGRPRGFCFVSFSSFHVVDKILVDNRFPIISNKRCEVRKTDDSVPITGAPPNELPNSFPNGGGNRNNVMSNRGGRYSGDSETNGRYNNPRSNMRSDMGYGRPPPGSYSYGGPSMDDSSMGMGYGSYYPPYSATQHTQYAQPTMHAPQTHSMGLSSNHPSTAMYDNLPSHVSDRHYPQSSYGAPSVSSLTYESQRQSMYGASQTPSSSVAHPQQDYSYQQSSIYGNTVSSQQQQPTIGGCATGGVNASNTQHPYASSQSASTASSTQTAGSSGYGSSYSHGGTTASSLGQTVSYPTRSYRPPSAAATSTQQTSSIQGVASGQMSQHRPY